MVQSLSQAIQAYGIIASSENKSARTIEWVTASAHFLRQFLGEDVSLGAISVGDVRRWVLAMRQRPRWAGCPQQKDSLLSSTSINNYVRGVKLLLSTLAREGLIPPHPVASIKPPSPAKTVIKPFTEAELRQIFKAIGGTEHPHRNRAALGLCFDPGLRLSEAVNLKLADINLIARSLIVAEGKGQKQRELPLGTWTTRSLLVYLNNERPQVESEYLFLEDDGTPLTAHAVQQILRRLTRRLGIRIHAHRLRHSGAIGYLRAGGDSLFLQRLLGHESLTMTRRYAQIAGADLQAAHRRFSPGDRLRL